MDQELDIVNDIKVLQINLTETQLAGSSLSNQNNYYYNNTTASVLRCDDLIGSLEAGKAADMVVLDGSGPHMMSSQHLSSELLRYASRAEVKTTIVAGKILYSDGEFPTIDIDRLREEAAAGASFVSDLVAERRYRPLPAW
ncbi:Amidohydrolase family protein [Bosea sp. CRIB-10]|uniref:amidohydrolase family protein n=1 Tax=Bosea sp. CRIB-10 TaxID=378404 RepID=UPI0008E15449|nr:amidohydrolase family protein [Bosea sp. CRIB-10]SFD70423.1 Amidohydrolase family protein [Bosea sp. CRIB-10]